MVNILCNGKRFTGIDAVFLDKDGTLADVAAYLRQLGSIQATLMEQLLPGTYELTLKALGMSADSLDPAGLLAVGSRKETILGTAAAAAMVGCPWIKAVDLAAATLAAAARQCSPKAAYTPLLPGVLEFLQRLRQAHLKIIMVSADAQKNLEQFVQHYRLQSYFDQLQGVNAQHPTKTTPDFLSTACQAVGVLPEQGLVIGDAASDLHMAESAHGFIGFLGGWQPTLSPADILGSTDRKTSVECEFAKNFSQIKLVL